MVDMGELEYSIKGFLNGNKNIEKLDETIEKVITKKDDRNFMTKTLTDMYIEASKNGTLDLYTKAQQETWEDYNMNKIEIDNDYYLQYVCDVQTNYLSKVEEQKDGLRR